MQSSVDIYNKQADVQAERSSAAAVGAWLQSLDVTEITKKQYRSSVKHFLAFMARHDCRSKADIAAFKAELLQSGKAASTVNLALQAAKSFFFFICESSQNEAAAAINKALHAVKACKRSNEHKRGALSAEQARELLSSVSCNKKQLKEKELRDAAIIALLLRGGLRTVEISRANVGDLKAIAGQKVLFVQGKGRIEKDNYIILTDAAAAALESYINKFRADATDAEPLFVSTSNFNRGSRLDAETVQKVAKAALRGIGIDNPAYTAHSLRHTAITLSIVGGADLLQAQAMARHASANTTLIYTHNILRVKKAAEFNLDRVLSGYSGRRVSRRFARA